MSLHLYDVITVTRAVFQTKMVLTVVAVRAANNKAALKSYAFGDFVMAPRKAAFSG